MSCHEWSALNDHFESGISRLRDERGGKKMTHRSRILLVLLAVCFAACGEHEKSETPVVVTDGQIELDEQANETATEENTGEVIEPAVPKKLTGIDAKLEESAVYFQSL